MEKASFGVRGIKGRLCGQGTDVRPPLCEVEGRTLATFQVQAPSGGEDVATAAFLPGPSWAPDLTVPVKLGPGAQRLDWNTCRERRGAQDTARGEEEPLGPTAGRWVTRSAPAPTAGCLQGQPLEAREGECGW